MDSMPRTTRLGNSLPEVCRLGLATRGGSQLQPDDVLAAIGRGVNYLNWCGRPDGLSRAVAQLGTRRRDIVVAVQFQARTAAKAHREFAWLLGQLSTDYIDIATMYYVESPEEWDQLTGPGGVWDYLNREKQAGRLRMIGITSHQRPLAARWARSGKLDMLMVRYNAAHRGAEEDVFPAAVERGIPVVTFTGLRWNALLKPTPEDPHGFRPPPAAEWYRFCLAHPWVSVALAAAGNRAQLEHALTLLDDWRAPDASGMDVLRAHGDRVHRHASEFW